MPIIPDQKTIVDSERRAKIKEVEFLREAREPRKYSRLDLIIAIILGILGIGFVIFVLSHYI
ncbi:hypothetical protein [Pyrococcus abyssi]|uniref:Uncharacterized protein n=1 Tax=Pyrococcus abyssi (strain GE5 / Orsay) TaxID=272844 RepID=G8ZGJ8_PYRAB|nr:hypothetical protein [Pyrococcus abyssi]CCE69877.1 TPA: hypothetical protein PAB0328.1n [Pyrococcus abyssi GE5]